MLRLSACKSKFPMHQSQGENPAEFPLEYTHTTSEEVWESFKMQNFAVVHLYLESIFI